MVGDERMAAKLRGLAVGETYRLPARYRAEVTVRNMLARTGYRWTVIEVITPKTGKTQFTVTRDA
jgi:hypothetical protein